MRKGITCIALAGLASAAGAQSGSLSIVPSASSGIDTSSGSATITLAVYGDADFGTAISGGGFGLAVSGAGVGNVTGMASASAPWGALGFMDLGDGGDGNHNGMIFGQLIFPPFIPPAAESMLGNGPVLLGNFTVTFAQFAVGVFDWATVGGIGDFTLEVFDESTGSFTQLSAEVAHGSASVIIFPSPSGLALLGFGGLVAGRRRR